MTVWLLSFDAGDDFLLAAIVVRFSETGDDEPFVVGLLLFAVNRLSARKKFTHFFNVTKQIYAQKHKSFPLWSRFFSRFNALFFM